MKRGFINFLAIGVLLFIGAGSSIGKKPKNIAVVKMIRGKVSATLGDQSVSLEKGKWIAEGTVIKTEAKSFCMVVFVDKSRVSVSPNSETKIEKFNDKEPGVISVLNGKIRSQVTKDYLARNKNKSKMFVKSKSAAMGIRGTDFMFSYNAKNDASSAILFEGSVQFAKIEDPLMAASPNALESLVSSPSARAINPGEFSVVSAKIPKATVPAVLNVKQKEALQNNVTFAEGPSPASSGKKESKSSVPPGLSGKVVANKSEVVEKVASENTPRSPQRAGSAASAEGFADKSGNVKPANGSSVHLESGTVVAPEPDSTYDSATNSYIPKEDVGVVDASGEFVPREGIEITDAGEVVEVVKSEDGRVSKRTIQNGTGLMPEAKVEKGSSYVPVNQGPMPAGAMNEGGDEVQNDAIDENFNPGGDVLDAATTQDRNTTVEDKADPGIINDRSKVNFRTRPVD